MITCDIGIKLKRIEGEIMKYCSVAQIASKWNLSERTVRDYCAKGKIVGAFFNWKDMEYTRNSSKTIAKKNAIRKSQIIY